MAYWQNIVSPMRGNDKGEFVSLLLLYKSFWNISMFSVFGLFIFANSFFGKAIKRKQGRS
ncbi:hypothetical protein A3715_16840 [Oleiphilus sp. HI0009]|nr:hypothetical protein A3715_16840 [Oleiphilus sp. HI0009]